MPGIKCQELVVEVQGAGDRGQGVRSAKPLPDESNREAIEEMLWHALQWGLENGGMEDGGMDHGGMEDGGMENGGVEVG